MKFFYFVCMAICLACGCQRKAPQESAPTASTAAFNEAGAPTDRFSVPDMMCEESCLVKVKEALSEQPGVAEVTVDFESKVATVAIDEQVFDSEAAIATLVDYQFGNSKLLIEEETAVTQ